MRRHLHTAIFLLLLSACAEGGTQQYSNNITKANENMVKGCQFLGELSGLSATTDVFASIASPRTVALDEAKQLKATHIVFNEGASRNSRNKSFARAYKCLPKAQNK